jgi:ferredoxin
MILYFSGTGNSKLVAHRLAALMQEKIYNLEQGAPPALHKGERLVLVAPLYFWTLPSIVLEYLAQHQQLNRHELHLVITCGGALGAGASLMTRQGQRLGFSEIYVHALVMTTNYIPLHRIQRPETARKAIDAALMKLPEVADKISKKQGAPTSAFLQRGLPLAQGMYDRARHTRHFYVTVRCIGCGLCEKDCPVQAIQLLSGSPKWIKPQCTLCLRCVHRCPVAAIEYGRSTVGKARYHPEKLFSIEQDTQSKEV